MGSVNSYHIYSRPQAMAGLSKLTVCNALPPSRRLSHLPFFVITLPRALFFHAPFLYLSARPTDCHILPEPLCFTLPQLTCLYLSAPLTSALGSFFFSHHGRPTGMHLWARFMAGRGVQLYLAMPSGTVLWKKHFKLRLMFQTRAHILL